MIPIDGVQKHCNWLPHVLVSVDTIASVGYCTIVSFMLFIIVLGSFSCCFKVGAHRNREKESFPKENQRFCHSESSSKANSYSRMAASLSNDTTDASAQRGEEEDLDVFVKELMENSKC